MPLILAPQLIGPLAGVEQNFYQDIVDAGLTTGLQLVVDAGSATSYSGSGQVWNDLAGNSVNFNRGTDNTSSTDDPTFNGTSGGLSSSEYWSFDGGDFFELESANPAWVDTLHKDNAKLTFIVWVYFAGAGGTNNGLISTSGLDSASDGCTLYNDAGPQIFLVEKAAGLVLQITADTSHNDAAWNFVGVSVDEATGAGGSFHYLNGSYNQVSASNTFDATYSAPGTAAADFRIHAGVAGDEAGAMANNDRMAGVMIWDTNLTKANMDTIWDAQKGRFGL